VDDRRGDWRSNDESLDEKKPGEAREKGRQALGFGKKHLNDLLKKKGGQQARKGPAPKGGRLVEEGTADRVYKKLGY